MSTPYIPSLDLGSYINGDDAQRKKFSDELGRAFNDSGFVTITNHGVDQELIDKLYANIQGVFALKPEQKKNMKEQNLPVSVVIPVQVKRLLKVLKRQI